MGSDQPVGYTVGRCNRSRSRVRYVVAEGSPLAGSRHGHLWPRITDSQHLNLVYCHDDDATGRNV